MTRCCEARFSALEQALGNRGAPAFHYCPWCGSFLGDALALEMTPGAQAAAVDLWRLGKRLESFQWVQDQAQAYRQAVAGRGDTEEARRMLFDAMAIHEALEKELAAAQEPGNHPENESPISPEDL